VAGGDEAALPEEPGDVDRGNLPTATVIVRALNIRNGPGTGYQKVGAVADGDELEVIGQVNTDCAEIPEAPAPEEPSGPTEPSTESGAASPATANTGCYVFQNNLGAELTVTFTSVAGDWNDTFRVGPGAELERCFAPGAYTYTLDAPPPWGSTNGDLDVAAGDYYLFPIDPAD
jgi:serine protease Do